MLFKALLLEIIHIHFFFPFFWELATKYPKLFHLSRINAARIFCVLASLLGKKWVNK